MMLRVVLLMLVAACRALAAEPMIVGLDHVPIAVADLRQAETDFRRLGFVLKPGRSHGNGIHNSHVKFADGTELELITAAQAVDLLTTEYREWIRQGDGPVFLGLYAPDRAAASSRLLASGAIATPEWIGFAAEDPRHWLFVSGRQHSPTDKPEHFRHPNGARRLAGVWLAGADAIVPLLDTAPTAAARCGPLGRAVQAVTLPEAEVLMLPVGAASRRVAAVILEVASIAVTRQVLAGAGVVTHRDSDCGASLWVAPADAHGLWLEFRQLGSKVP